MRHLAGGFNEMLSELDKALAGAKSRRKPRKPRADGVSVPLLNASPAVIYCRTASGDFDPTFVSESVTRLFGCSPREYLDNPYLWRDRVHPDDVARINDWVDDSLFGTTTRSSIASAGRTAPMSG